MTNADLDQDDRTDQQIQPVICAACDEFCEDYVCDRYLDKWFCPDCTGDTDRADLIAGWRLADQLATACRRLLQAHVETVSDSEGRYPRPDSGCSHCTEGTVPSRFDTGLCAFHAAKALLKKVAL